MKSRLSVWHLLKCLRRYLVLRFVPDGRGIAAPNVGANLFTLVAEDRRHLRIAQIVLRENKQAMNFAAAVNKLSIGAHVVILKVSVVQYCQ